LQSELKQISKILAAWYKKNKRSLPWRETKDPYKIWLSEIILQQTRVDQGLAYWLKFVERFPTVKDLAEADEDEVLKLWQGLGYYSRARNLHSAAKEIVRSSGVRESGSRGFPDCYDEIIKLKGVGAYTAAAISSICFGEAKAVVDGNVYRVLSRVFGIKTAIDSTKGKKEFQLVADELLDKKNPGDHNQAVMEFGARQCTPKNPDCGACPLEEICVARRKKLIDLLPVKEKKTKVRHRHFYYFVFDYRGKTFLKQRDNPKDIWRNLYEFPLSDFDFAQSDKGLLVQLKKDFLLGTNDFIVKDISSDHKHILSHQILNAKFFRIELKRVPAEMKKKFILVKMEEVNDYALPRLIDRYWNG
jgi:A/G-specific adenine glycosylase